MLASFRVGHVAANDLASSTDSLCTSEFKCSIKSDNCFSLAEQSESVSTGLQLDSDVSKLNRT